MVLVFGATARISLQGYSGVDKYIEIKQDEQTS